MSIEHICVKRCSTIFEDIVKWKSSFIKTIDGACVNGLSSESHDPSWQPYFEDVNIEENVWEKYENGLDLIIFHERSIHWTVLYQSTWWISLELIWYRRGT